MKGLSKGRYDETFAGEDDNFHKEPYLAYINLSSKKKCSVSKEYAF